MGIFSLEGFLFVVRWFHIFFGIIWIGVLYYFNFIQGSFLAETDPAAKSQVLQKLAPRALWWFRYGALGTFLMGLVYLMTRGHLLGVEGFASAWGVSILTGAVMGTLMFLNVWVIIWPNQKIVIQNAKDTAEGKPANPAAAASASRAGVASRINTLFSIPMLFYMAGARHLPLQMNEMPNFLGLFIAFAIIIGGIEWVAIKGKTGPITTVKGVIHMGFLLTAVLYVVMEILV